MKTMKANPTHAASRSAPRNPLVAIARFRRAGAHQDGRKTARQGAARALRQMLAEGSRAKRTATA